MKATKSQYLVAFTHYLFGEDMRPSLGKKVFPVCRVAPKNASREVGIFFFSNFIFYRLECTGGSKKKKKEFENMKKKSSSRPFLAHPAGGQETTFYLRVA